MQKDMLINMFEKQGHLMRELGIDVMVPVDLQAQEGQQKVRNYVQYILEEVGEVLHEIYISSSVDAITKELADVLSFLIELTILSGVKPEELVFEKPEKDLLSQLYNECTPNEHTFDELVSLLVMDCGNLCNLLQNKPWRKKETVVDDERYKCTLRLIWIDVISMCQKYISDIFLSDVYNVKHFVNLNRIREGY